MKKFIQLLLLSVSLAHHVHSAQPETRPRSIQVREIQQQKRSVRVKKYCTLVSLATTCVTSMSNGDSNIDTALIATSATLSAGCFFAYLYQVYQLEKQITRFNNERPH